MKNALRNTALALAALLGGLAISGCGRPESDQRPVGSESVPSEAVAAKPRGASPAIPPDKPSKPVPAPAIPPDAPVLSQKHPFLSNGALKAARLAALPEGALLQAEGVSITRADLEAELAKVPEASRDELRRNAFLLVEQKATMALLLRQARAAAPDASADDDDALLRGFFDRIAAAAKVEEPEVEAFFSENPDLVGDAKLDEIAPRIREHLLGQKRQAIIENFVAELGVNTPIAVAADWVAEQAAIMLDNPVDRARASGKPTFVNFGSKGCRPCDMMEPIREEIKQQFADRLNVVFVPVNQERMLSSRYGISGIPHLLFFDKDGRQVHAHTGFMPKEQILSWAEKAGLAL